MYVCTTFTTKRTQHTKHFLGRLFTFHGMGTNSCSLDAFLTSYVQCTRLDNAICDDILNRDFRAPQQHHLFSQSNPRTPACRSCSHICCILVQHYWRHWDLHFGGFSFLRRLLETSFPSLHSNGIARVRSRHLDHSFYWHPSNWSTGSP